MIKIAVLEFYGNYTSLFYFKLFGQEMISFYVSKRGFHLQLFDQKLF